MAPPADADTSLEQATEAVTEATSAARTALQLAEDYANDLEWRRQDERDARNDALRHED
jgi:hypothetical protein